MTSVINVEAKHEIVNIYLSAQDKELMDLLEEEIEVASSDEKRVLRMTSVINMEAKHEIVNIYLSAQDKELMDLLEEQIEVALSDEK
nr:hypothetical protein [Tanacetum cinerariifolium]